MNSIDVLSAISLLKPYEIDLRKIRLGPKMDGGYIFADRLSCNPVLAFGVGTNIDLEVDFADAGHNVYLFDHTVDHLPKERQRIVFFKKGIAGSCSPDGTMIDLPEALRLSGLDTRSDIILKIDVEGSEFEAIGSCPKETIERFTQIAIEVHWLSLLPDWNFRMKFESMMRKLTRSFTVFHVHGNNCAGLSLIGGASTDQGEKGGFPVVDVLELSMIRNDLVKRTTNATVYPTSLDYPNLNIRPDHILSFFPFLPNHEQTTELLLRATELNDLRFNHEESRRA